MTWYMGWVNARPRVIRGTRVKPLPLLPSGPGGVCSRPLHEARSLTTTYGSRRRGPRQNPGEIPACKRTNLLMKLVMVDDSEQDRRLFRRLLEESIDAPLQFW